MPYTFGAATGNDINNTLAVSMGAASRAQLVWGWWYPTTLTASRAYWSAGNIFSAEISPGAQGTDDILFTTDNATTDGQWETTGAGITTDAWWFLAFLSTQRATATNAVRIWRGSLDTAPTSLTITNITAASGAFTGSTAFTIGNFGTDVFAFQGDIAGVGYVASSAAAGPTHPFQLATLGSITASEEEFVYQNFVLPAWLGKTVPLVNPASSGITEIGFWDGEALTSIRRYLSGAATSLPVAPTVNGATVSARAHPRGIGNPHCHAQFLRR